MKTQFLLKTITLLILVNGYFFFNSTAQSWQKSGSTLYYNSGKVGIGTSSPRDMVQIGSGIRKLSLGTAYGSSLDWGTSYIGFNMARSGSTWYLDGDGGSNGGSAIYGLVNGSIHFAVLKKSGGSDRTVSDNSVKANNKMIIHSDGRVQIGGVTPSSLDYLLFVEKGIQTGRIKVDAGFADYVFEEGYTLLSLPEVEAHIKQKGHLHNTPSAKEIEADGGFDVGEITVNQQEKIEELYLHIISLSKRLESIEKENKYLKGKINE